MLSAPQGKDNAKLTQCKVRKTTDYFQLLACFFFKILIFYCNFPCWFKQMSFLLFPEGKLLCVERYLLGFVWSFCHETLHCGTCSKILRYSTGNFKRSCWPLWSISSPLWKKSLHFTVFFSRWSWAEIIEMASEVILAERDFWGSLQCMNSYHVCDGFALY